MQIVFCCVVLQQTFYQFIFYIIKKLQKFAKIITKVPRYTCKYILKYLSTQRLDGKHINPEFCNLNKCPILPTHKYQSFTVAVMTLNMSEIHQLCPWPFNLTSNSCISVKTRVKVAVIPRTRDNFLSTLLLDGHWQPIDVCHFSFFYYQMFQLNVSKIQIFSICNALIFFFLCSVYQTLLPQNGWYLKNQEIKPLQIRVGLRYIHTFTCRAWI